MVESEEHLSNKSFASTTAGDHVHHTLHIPILHRHALEGSNNAPHKLPTIKGLLGPQELRAVGLRHTLQTVTSLLRLFQAWDISKTCPNPWCNFQGSFTDPRLLAGQKCGFVGLQEFLIDALPGKSRVLLNLF